MIIDRNSGEFQKLIDKFSDDHFDNWFKDY